MKASAAIAAYIVIGFVIWHLSHRWEWIVLGLIAYKPVLDLSYYGDKICESLNTHKNG